jgi:hypothetical protein
VEDLGDKKLVVESLLKLKLSRLNSRLGCLSGRPRDSTNLTPASSIFRIQESDDYERERFTLHEYTEERIICCFVKRDKVSINFGQFATPSRYDLFLQVNFPY